MTAPPEAPTRSRTGLLSVLTAHSFATVGMNMTFIAMPWFVMETTGSIARTGAVVGVYTVGAAIAGFLAGPAVDRLGFRRVSVAAYLVGGLAMAAVVLLHYLDALTFPALLGLVLVATSFDAPGGVALSGLIPGLARRAGTPLERANSSFRAIASLGQLFGPLLGGVATVFVGPHNVLLLDALGGIIAALIIALLVRQPPGPVIGAPAGGLVRRGYLADLASGLRVLRRVRLLRTLAATGAGHNFLDGGLVGIVLVVAAFTWYGDAASFGLMVTAFGAGALAGTVCYGIIGHRLSRRWVFVVASLLMGVPLLPLGAAPPLPVTMAALAVLGLIAAPVGPLTASVLQETAPAGSYGRVVSTIRVIASSTNPLGIICATATVTVYGLEYTLLGMAVGYLVIGVGCLWSWSLRDLELTRTAPESCLTLN